MTITAKTLELGGLRHRTHYPLKRLRVLINVKESDAVRAEADEGLVTHILAQAKINWRNDQVGPPKRRGADPSNGLFRGGQGNMQLPQLQCR